MNLESIWQDEKYRSLSPEQIVRLQEQGCTCKDWLQVKVTGDFDTDNVHFVHFSGRIRLGVFREIISFPGGVNKHSGIRNATVHECIIGDNVFINNVASYIANYIIEDNAVIDNIGLLAVDGESAFGNGTEVVCINEAGGREVPIYDRLSSHIAYIIALYRYRPEVIENLRAMICSYTDSVKSTMGLVGTSSSICNSRIIKNVKIGPHTIIDCATELENGSINSCHDACVYIGPDVIAKDFIISSGARISDGAHISKCFVGQSTELSKQYSAENCLFFANCEGMHGEACSIFAGPYTVTHHKSTLLIAGLFSFFNAGSGTNQSNHMYKLGPVHQGIVERGSKTGSDSYLLWPTRLGAFTIVKGRHYSNIDTSDLPFSYLIENDGQSILIPGASLRNVGTIRDASKWPSRDKRKSSDKLDMIHFELFNPYTIQKMLNGRDVLLRLKDDSNESTQYCIYNNVKIRTSSCDRGISIYETAIYYFLGDCLLRRLQEKQFTRVEDVQEALKPKCDAGAGKWFDLAGLFAPGQVVQKLLTDIENGTINAIEQAGHAIKLIYENYPEFEWAFAADVLRKMSGKQITEINTSDIIELITKCNDAQESLNNQFIQDAQRDFATSAQIGYGIDGDLENQRADFESVRGAIENNEFLNDIQNLLMSKNELANECINRLKQIS